MHRDLSWHPAYITDCVFWANLYAPISLPNIAMLPVIMLACGNEDIPSDYPLPAATVFILIFFLLLLFIVHETY